MDLLSCQLGLFHSADAGHRENRRGDRYADVWGAERGADRADARGVLREVGVGVLLPVPRDLMAGEWAADDRVISPPAGFRDVLDVVHDYHDEPSSDHGFLEREVVSVVERGSKQMNTLHAARTTSSSCLG